MPTTVTPITPATATPCARTCTAILIGQAWPEQGGILGAIIAGPVFDGIQLPNMGLIVPTDPKADFEDVEWGNYGTRIDGADSQTDGMANTLAMVAAGSELAQRIADLRIGGHADWFLPASRQQRAVAANVPHLFDQDDWYWTSTQYSRHDAFGQHFAHGGSYGNDKSDELRARPLRLIQL